MAIKSFVWKPTGYIIRDWTIGMVGIAMLGTTVYILGQTLIYMVASVVMIDWVIWKPGGNCCPPKQSAQEIGVLDALMI
jgi:hypothetical protein